MDTLEEQMNNITIHNITCRVCNLPITAMNQQVQLHMLCHSCYSSFKELIHESCITCGNDFWQTDDQEVECPQCISRYAMEDV